MANNWCWVKRLGENGCEYAGREPFAARKAATAERMSKSRSGKLGTQGVYGMKAGGSVSSASRRGDGCAIRGKTKGRMV